MSAAAGGHDPRFTAGARLGDRAGRRAVLQFGDPVAEAEALRSAAGGVPLGGLAAWQATGGAAQAFLHRMLTQDVRSLAVGDGRPALLLDARGRIQGDPFVWRLADRYVLTQEPAAAVRAMPMLEHYVIADDVTWRDVSAEWETILLAGATTPEVLERAGPALRALGALVARADLRERPGGRVLVPAGAADALMVLANAGVRPAGEEALDRARVETGTPWYGAELDDRVLPNEAGLDAAISWTKGCYVGQEPVVMARHRGHPATLLVGLSIGTGPVPPREAALLLDAKPVGRVTTALARPAGPGADALGFVRHEHARVGAAFALEGSGALATVTAVHGR